MKLVRFDLKTHRPVPFYAHLSNLYLTRQDLKITVGRTTQGYLLEAEGTQAQLEQLANDIAEDYLMSAWLVDSDLQVVDQRIGQEKPLTVTAPIQDYCNACHPHFGDNQSPAFGQITTICPVCHGEQDWLDQEFSLALAKEWCAQLLSNSATSITLGDGTRLSLQPLDAQALRPQLLICNPNTLNQHFAVTHEQVLALSAVEKPSLTLFNRQRSDKLPLACYQACFSYNRQIIVIAELLRQKAVDFVYLDPAIKRPHYTWLNHAWSEVESQAPIDVPNAPEPLHEQSHVGHTQARWFKKRILFQASEQNQPLPDQDLAQCALLGTRLEKQLRPDHHTAAIYFSSHAQGQLLYTNEQLELTRFLGLPELPHSGETIVAELLANETDAPIAVKFAIAYPEIMVRLKQLRFTERSNTLTALFALCAIVLDLDIVIADHTLTHPQHLADALEGLAMAHKGTNSPRIDFPLLSLPDDQGLTINWHKTLNAIMAYRLAERSARLDPHTPSNPQAPLIGSNEAKIAFGIHDSLADYLANWIEHLDNKYRVEAIALLGNELNNNLLTKRLVLRLGKNFNLLINRKLPLDGGNLAAGALYLKQRRALTPSSAG